MEKLLTVDDVTKLLQISKSTAYLLAKQGKIPSIKIGGSLRFTEDSLKAYIESQLNGTK